MKILLLDSSALLPKHLIKIRTSCGLPLFHLIRSSSKCFALPSEAPKFRSLFPFKRIYAINSKHLEEQRTDFVYFVGNHNKGYKELIAF